jgi:hypothetical protein
LIMKDGHQFELECKTIKEDTGSTIQTEDSIVYFREGLKILSSIAESGIIRLIMDLKPDHGVSDIRTILSTFISSPHMYAQSMATLP